MLVWRDSRKMLDADKSVTAETLNSPNIRMELLDAFHARYNFNLPPELQPSDHTLGVLVKLHARRSCDFLSLARVNNMIDSSDLKVDTQTRTKIGKEITLILDKTDTNYSQKNSDFNASAFTFVHAVRVLLYGYCLVSSKDPPAGCLV